ncbi:hypothetical protein SAMN05444004_10541 [Jannaschia faecimaris]|uniref:Uncharacterized protein n=1 Tax=Jannaschia faecimaris TaxID=1244108 RepID=A0A1H3PJT9_9RHOB|nr:hypothetical protein [Jannaschia faecimaris]SDZ01452.1 hypothetical protein SAMN05444004_10541 [Jannaschia faecimaris]
MKGTRLLPDFEGQVHESQAQAAERQSRIRKVSSRIGNANVRQDAMIKAGRLRMKTLAREFRHGRA